MSILDRSSLEQSTLADLHAIASELSIDSFRRLRKAQLIDAIIERQGGGGDAEAGEQEIVEAEGPAEAVSEETRAREEDQPAARRRRGRRGGRGRGGRDREDGTPAEEPGRSEGSEQSQEGTEHAGDELVEGFVDVLAGGSGFIRVHPPEPSDEDVYVSAAQIRRCELLTGDRIAGRRRPPRRSERFASLVRVESVNGRPASELAETARFDDLPATFPTQRLPLGSADPTLAAIDSLAPIGRGSRMTIVGPALTGKTEAARRLAGALSGVEDLALSLVLAGVRPEEVSEWEATPQGPSAAFPIGSSPDAVGQALEATIEQVRRQVSRGGHAALVIDTFDAVSDHVARRVLASARSLDEERSLTVIATASRPLGGETTVVALDPQLAGTGNFPAIDVQHTWTIHADRLVGQEGAQKIGRVRAAAFRR